MPDFAVADAEFGRQASILQALLEAVRVSSGQDGVTKHVIGGAELPLIPTGGQNTMVAAAVVLLASHFEEYVRQQVEEYGKGVLVEYATLTDEFREKLIDNYWKAGTAKLGRIRPKGDAGWITDAEPTLAGLINYPVKGDLSHFVVALLCEHENNMRWDTLADLSGRVGVKSLSRLLHKSSKLRSLLGSPKADEMAGALRSKLNEFYVLRNGIVHSISQHSGIGASIFDQWTDFLKVLTTAIADAFQASFGKFEVEADKAKAKLAA